MTSQSPTPAPTIPDPPPEVVPPDPWENSKPYTYPSNHNQPPDAPLAEHILTQDDVRFALTTMPEGLLDLVALCRGNTWSTTHLRQSYWHTWIPMRWAWKALGITRQTLDYHVSKDPHRRQVHSGIACLPLSYICRLAWAQTHRPPLYPSIQFQTDPTLAP